MSFNHPLALLLFVPLAALAVFIWHDGYLGLSERRRQVALLIRLLLVLAIVLSLAGASLVLPQNREAVVFVADLSASDAGRRDVMQGTIQSALASRPPDALGGVVSLGRQAVVEAPPAALSSFDGFQTFGSIGSQDFTNLEGGLELGSAVLPSGYRRRVVLMTDGRQNVGDALTTARLLHAEGVRLDVLPVRVPGGPEVMVDSVTAPSGLRPHERFTFRVAVRSNIDTTSTLDIYRDRSLTIDRQVHIHAGTNEFSFDQAPLHAGFHSLEVRITPRQDTEPQNNRGTASMLVTGPPHVLVIAAVPHEAANVMTSLKATNIRADLKTPVEVVPSLDALQRYAAVVVVDTPADVLGSDLMADLVPYVRDLGRGLVVVGGQESYGLGGYGQTPLEQALPVKMDLPKRKDLPSAAVALVIENLEADTEVNISKRAGEGVVNLLTVGDQVAVSDALGDGSLVVPLQHVRDKAAIDRAIENMQPGDPQSYLADLQAAAHALKGTTARVKHIILLGDGDAEDPEYERVVKNIRSSGITVSTVATNGLGFSDWTLMRHIAQWGGGRAYRADNTAAVPQIFLREARTVARSGIVPGKFFPQELSANPMVRDMASAAPLYGYVATTPKPTGEMVLVSPKLDPVLAAWQFGLGRSVAWTSDSAGLWSRDWLRSPGAGRFWSNLVSWVLPTAGAGKLFVSASSSHGQGQISVDVPPVLGGSPAVTAHVTGPDLKTTVVQLQPSAPGQFRGSFLSNRQGAYFVTAEAKGQGHAQAGQAGLDVPYSAEYRDVGTDGPFLRALAAAGGGSVVTGADAAWKDNLSPVSAQHSLEFLLLLLTLLLLPIDIGVRRLIVDRRDLARIWAAVRQGRPAPREATPALAPLGAVRVKRSVRREGTVPVVESAGATRTVAPVTVKPTVVREPRPQPQVSPGESTGAAPPPPSGLEQPQERTSEESTTSKLLAAKRRKRV